MKLSPRDIEELKAILAACKVVGVDGIVIHEGQARGAKPSLDAAVLTRADLTVSEALKLGIGRVTELEKRLAIFPGPVEIDGKSNERGDVSLLTLSSGRTKVQFRCTSEALMRYPKSNDDQPFAVIQLARAEVLQISRAVKTLGATQLVLQVGRTGAVRLECLDSARDMFDIELTEPAEFIGEAGSAVQTYLAALLVDVLDAGAKETETVTFVLGEVGSVTGTVRGHTVVIFPQIGGTDD